MAETARNQKIISAMESGRVPVLPFELELAKNALAQHAVSQRELAKRLGEAMQQSSETWHDNAPADEISHDSRRLAAVAERTIRVLNLGEVFEYGGSPEDGVTLGSAANVKYGNDPESTLLVLTGVSRELPPELSAQLPADMETDIVTLGSPLGSAILGKKIGEEASFDAPNGRTIRIAVEDITQLNPVEAYEDISSRV
jgi:transcription elongation factor GreA